METTSTTSASSIATRLGVGSGTDMIALAEDLARAQFEPRQQRLENRSEVLERQISLASTLRNMLSSFASALGDRVRNGDLSAQPNITNSAIAKVSAPIGTSGKGTYSLEVTQLARAQTLAGPAYSAATDTVGAGQLTIRFGATDNAAFTEDTSKDAVTIDIAAGATLADVAKAINAKGSGVTAYVSQTTGGAQLVLKGPEGANNGFVIEASEDAANPGLANLAWAPGDEPARLLATSGDAAYKLDGLERTSPSNTIENAAPGLSLDLTGTNPGNPTTIGFGDPKAAVISAMTDIVGALNEIAAELNSATDPLTGDLARDEQAQRDGDGRPISPVEFIPAAEDMDQIGALGAWALHEATSVAAAEMSRATATTNVRGPLTWPLRSVASQVTVVGPLVCCVTVQEFAAPPVSAQPSAPEQLTLSIPGSSSSLNHSRMASSLTICWGVSTSATGNRSPSLGASVVHWGGSSTSGGSVVKSMNTSWPSGQRS